MANDPDNLVLDLLRAMRDDVAKVAYRLDNLTAEVRVLKGHTAALVQSDLNRDERFANLEVRLDRIERRLNLVN